ncbi:MAG TPA: hypothetical protein VNO26_01400 [Candidatus Limnocylindria bacterium]|nr:hypothetical protein [Candidatus Limnocylindria bacterium]
MRRVAEASDRVPALPLRAGPELRALVLALPPALASRRVSAVEPIVQRIADGTCRALAVPGVRVRVQLRRPHNATGELHGIYVPVPPPARPEVTLWMLTAKRGDVVKPRTFLRTLLHELCHHFDYTWLRLRDSLHTQGFYQRESSLFAALGGRALDPS